MAALTPKPHRAPPIRCSGVTAMAATKVTLGSSSDSPTIVTDAAGKTRWIWQLTPAQMAEQKQLGVCYNCDEKYHRNHNCKQLYLIEFVHYDFEDEEEAAETDSEISLHALTGINTCRTMQLEVRVGDATLTTLVDLGTTHNFAS